ncbi:hypothetical protein AJ80_06352 [Polytolypa hystricis UAMH7299]|uniref:Copper transport protein n=1 Tax=Polytolypa hystricis (strain UAMH7299) TaxID=1447883 RepID=A0A2B7XXS1_POLH7|nr:hypothetical protein AJ80_06352 [Polytolypa hystricis UAMH7299]
MSHSGHSSTSSGGSGEVAMAMVFQNIQATPLYSDAWTPRSNGAYAGTCIFLIVFAIIFRVLMAAKALLEQRWMAAAMARRYVVVAGQTPEAERVLADPNGSTGTLVTPQGVEEKVRVVHRAASAPMPWRFSVDLPRAALVMVIVGVGYLLMLAVMTMNVGFFMSVLAGVFIGELAVGRFIQMEEH